MKAVFIVMLSMILTIYMWKSGLLVVQRKIAVAFIGRRGKNHWGAGFTACTGYVKKVLPLTESAKYRFYYQADLTEGDILVEISQGKNVVRTFDIHNRTAVIKAEKGTYTITARFKKASGDFKLRWETI